MKRGDISLNYIIVAIISLIVLIVVVLIFVNGADWFVNNLKGITSGILNIKPNLESLK